MKRSLVGLTVALIVLVPASLFGQPPRAGYYLTVQPIQVRNDDGSNASTVVFYESETDKIWRQAGIDVRFLSQNTYNSTAHNTIDNNAEFSAMVSGAGHGQNADATVLNAWYVDQINPSPTDTTYGIAYVDANGAAFDGSAISAYNGGVGRLDTVAHETGHNLGLDHNTYGAGGANNLMTTGSDRNVPSSLADITPDGSMSQLTNAQITEVMNSPFVKGALQQVDLAAKTVTEGVKPEDMANFLVAGGGTVTVQNVQYFGANNASGKFSGGSGRIDSFDAGVILTSGSAANAFGPNDSDSTSTDNGLVGTPLLDPFTTGTTYDASILSFDFIPTGNKVTFQYVFASDEYNEYAGSQFNDVFGFFVNGINQAVIPGTTTPVAINNVNWFTNTASYVNNSPWGGGPDPVPAGSLRDIEYDGLTTVFALESPVNPGVVNHIDLAIADVGDHVWDSAVFIEEGTFETVVEPGTPPGATPADPLLPTFTPPGGGFGFGFDPLPGFTFIDPVMAIGYDYRILSGPWFTSFVLPVLPFNTTYDLYLFDALLGDFALETTVDAGLAYSFASPVNLFRIWGIDPQNMLDPADPLAFPTGLTFETLEPVQMTMTPHAIPELSSFVIWSGLGAIGLLVCGLRRRRRQS